MKRTTVIATTTPLVMIALVANAAPEKAATKMPGAGAGAPAAEAPMMEAPKPAPEVEQAAKAMQGTWKCAGTVMASPMAPEHKVEGTMTWKLEMDKFWLVGAYAEKKTKENPMPYKFVEYRTYDAADKSWMSVSADNAGMWSAASGSSDGKIAKWESKSKGMGMTMSMRMTEEMKGPKEVHVFGDMSMDGKDWKPGFDVTCKK